MPATTTSFGPEDYVDFAIAAAGVYWLWADYVRPKVWARSAPNAALAPWVISTEAFLFALLRLFGVSFCTQLLVVQMVHAWAPQFSFTSGFGIVVSGGAFQIGMLLGVGVAHYFIPRVPVAPWDLEAAAKLPQPERGGRMLASAFKTFLVATTAVVAITYAWQHLLGRFGIEAKEQDLLVILRNSESMWERVAILVLAVVVAPVSEEFIFRAGFFRYLRTRTYRGLALAASAALFSALHYNLNAFPALFALGLIFSLAYERTGSIRVTMLAHGLFNLHTFAVLYLAGKL